MPAPDSRLIRSIDAFSQQRQSIIDRVLMAVVSLFAPFDEWTNPGPIAAVTAQAGRYVSSGQRAIAALTDAYLSRTTSRIRGSLVSPAGVGPEMSGVLRTGQDSWITVYSRLPAEYRWQVSQGKSKDDALEITLNRLREMASEDLGLANQWQTAKFTHTRNVARFRRVIRGENTCGLCVAAASRIYTRGDLLPIHGRCRCTVMEIKGSDDPGSAINDDAIDQAYKDALEQTRGMKGKGLATGPEKLKKVRFEVVQHGELGPQLRVKGQQFRGPSDVAKDTGAQGFWTRENVTKQISMTEALPDSTWRTGQLARLRDWIDNN